MQNKRDLAFELVVRKCPEYCRGGRSNLNRSDVLLSDVGDDPDTAEIGDLIEHGASLDLLAFDHFLLDDHAADRRRPVDFYGRRVFAVS